MVRKDLGVKSALELAGASVCVNIGTTTELNLSDYFRANGMDFNPVVFEKADEVAAAYDAGRCDVYTTDQSGLAAQRIKLAEPSAHVILPEVISKEPLGPVVRHGDDQWLDIVKWSLYAMVEAEELGVTSKNAADMKANSENPNIRRLLGVEGDMGKNLGLGNDWAFNIVTQVGNYGESFARYVGPDTALGLERGVNALWKDGGLQYAMPVR
jgi:general L-amino acid transport system substrate-binding protein